MTAVNQNLKLPKILYLESTNRCDLRCNGCILYRGSWEPGADDANGRARDRLTTTAFHLLTGQIYYRYGRAFGGGR